MAVPPQHRLTWADLERMPDDDNRYELLDGELVVTPAAGAPHGWASLVLAARLFIYMQEHGGRPAADGLAVFLAEGDIVIPDATYTRPERIAELFGADLRGAMGSPDLIAEVSSPSTRGRDLIVKRALYERHGVEEYWFVDRDAECVLVHLLIDGAYGPPRRVGRGEVLHATAAPGFALDVGELFDDPRS